MNTTQVRFTLNEASKGPLVVYDPIGWDTCPISLLREKDYSEVIEVMDAPFTFIGPAIEYLLECEAIGIDTAVTLLIEVTEDGGHTFELFFEGLVNLPTKNDLLYPTQFKLQYNVKKTDIWSTFYKRKSTSVNVSSVTDLDGNAVASVSTLLRPLPSQVIDRLTRVETYRFDDSSYTSLIWDITAVNIYGAIDLPNEITNEILTKFHLPAGIGPDFPVSLIDIAENGTYDFDISLTFADHDLSPTEGPTTLYFFVKARIAGVDYTFAQLYHGVAGTNQTSQYTFTASGIPLKSGQQIFIYLQWTNPGLVGTLPIYMVAGGIRPGWESYINIIGHTIGNLISNPVILTHDVADAVIKRIAPTSLYSPFFGGAAQGYGSNGCGYPYANIQGLQLRNFTLADKPLTMSFDDWWAGANPIFNLGLGIEVIAGVDRIYIDEKRKFYDASDYSIKIPNVEPISGTHKVDMVYNSIQIGGSKWQLSAGGSQIDDHGPHKYASPARLIGGGISVMTTWIIAPLLLELTRRASVKTNQTFDTDNDVFIIKLKTDLSGPDLDGAATDLLNAASRYNKTLTPARMFLKWLNVLNVGLSQYIAHPLMPSFKFISGLGNFISGVTISTPCEVGGAVVENADIPITSDAIVTTDVIDFEWEMSWPQYKLIRDAKRKMIGIASDSSTYTYYFIQKIDFFLFKGNAKFTLIKCPNPFET